MFDGDFEGVSIVVIDAKPRLGIRKKVLVRVKSNTCLCCEQKATRRGLCKTCYFRFRAAYLSFIKREQPNFEAKMIRAGKLLPTRQGQRIRSLNPFKNSKGA